MNINKYNIKYYLIEENSKKKLSGKNIKKIIRPKSASDLNINDKNSNLIYNFKNGNPRKFLSNNSLKSIMIILKIIVIKILDNKFQKII